MKFTFIFLIIAVALTYTDSSAPPADKLSTREARDHIGRQATVCGRVASAKFAISSHGRPTFLNLDEPYPRHIFTALIWQWDRQKFGRPEQTLAGKSICVTGLISAYRGRPQMILRFPQQLRVQ